MPAFTIPPKATSGFLTIEEASVAAGAPVDVTCHARYVDLTDDGGTEVDNGTWCDPAATSYTTPKDSVEIEWRNSFTDGTDDGLYDVLLPYVGLNVTFTVKPYGADGPSWAWMSYIPSVPIGKFEVDQPVIVPRTYGRSGTQYTPGTVAVASQSKKK